MLFPSNYQVSDKLYESKTTFIFKGKRKNDNRPVILKVLNDEFPNSEKIAKFSYEYDLLKKFKSDKIIKTISFENFKNYHMIIFEDFDGKDLSKFEDFYKNSIEDKIKVFIKIAEGIEVIHKKEIIHKNINPENILISHDFNIVKIIDFGIASQILNERLEDKNYNCLEENISYISPEQTGKMNRSIDYRADFYSLGVTFYKLITGELPFKEKDYYEIINSHISKKQIPVINIDKTIPHSLSDLIDKLLQKHAEDRYQSIEGIISDLKKCLNLLEKKGANDRFELGLDENYNKFKIPQNLYGREKEIKFLVDQFNETIKGNLDFILVEGSPGIGKSFIVNETNRYVNKKNGYFISGKYEQFNENTPYSALTDSIRDFIFQIKKESPESFRKWKEKIEFELGENANVIIEIIPELEEVIGKREKLVEVLPSELEYRFLLSFRKFIKAISSKEKPLLIFLDDLQWGDSGTTKLIYQLLKDREIEGVLLVGAYRVEDKDKVSLSLASIMNYKKVQKIVLKNLKPNFIEDIIKDSLYDVVNIGELAKVIKEITQGNPFYIIELIKKLYEVKIIYYDINKKIFNWDKSKLDKIEKGNDIVEFFVKKVKDLPKIVMETLKKAACIGNSFDFKVLSLINEEEPTTSSKALWRGVLNEIISPINEKYKYIHIQEEKKDDDDFNYFNARYKFRHDKVQQALYYLNEVDERKKLHLKIGKLMLISLSEENKKDKIIDIANHLNGGLDLLTNKEEKLNIAEINLEAGKKAKKSAAFEYSLEYFSKAKLLLSDDIWDSNYNFIKKVYKEFSVSSYICGKYIQAEENSNYLLTKVRSTYEKAEIRAMQLTQYSVAGEPEKAIDAGIKGLELLNEKIKKDPSKIDILFRLIKVYFNIKKRSTDEIFSNIEIKDPKILLKLKFYSNFTAASYLSGNMNLFAFAVLKQTYYSLKYGNSELSSVVYSNFSVLLAALGKLKISEKYGKLSLEFADHYNDLKGRCKTVVLYALFCHTWNSPWNELPDLYREAIEYGFRSGDMLYSSFAYVYINLLDYSLDIETILKDNEKYILKIKETNYQNALEAACIAQHKYLNFIQGIKEKVIINKEVFDIKKCFDEMTASNYISGIAQYYIAKIHIYYYYERYDEAEKILYKADEVIESLTGSPYLIEYCLYGFFTMTAIYKRSSINKKIKIKLRIKKELKRMKKWTNNNRDNFLYLELLMEAEYQTLFGNRETAIKLFQNSIDLAKSYKYIRVEALAYELLAKFYLKINKKDKSKEFMEKALKFYKKNGSNPKSDFLEKKYLI